MDNKETTKSGLCKHSLHILHELYRSNFGDTLADTTLSLDAFRSNPSVANFVTLKRNFEEMTIAYEKMRVFEIHGG